MLLEAPVHPMEKHEAKAAQDVEERGIAILTQSLMIMSKREMSGQDTKQAHHKEQSRHVGVVFRDAVSNSHDSNNGGNANKHDVNCRASQEAQPHNGEQTQCNASQCAVHGTDCAGTRPNFVQVDFALHHTLIIRQIPCRGIANCGVAENLA